MVVILGATGNIGSKIADALLKKGQKISVVGRSAEKLAGFVARGAESAVGDVSDASFLARIFMGAVCHDRHQGHRGLCCGASGQTRLHRKTGP